MSKLNKDVIFQTLKELHDKSLYSCLVVNRTWCEIVVPILWKNPAGRTPLTKKAKCVLSNVILFHLSEESRDILKNQGINLFTETYQQPLFNYISFWRHFDLIFLEYIDSFVKDIEKSKVFIIKSEILNLFNRNTKFVSLFI